MLPSATVTIVVSRKVRNSTASTVVSAIARGTERAPTTVCCTGISYHDWATMRPAHARTGVGTAAAPGGLCGFLRFPAAYWGVCVAVGVLQAAGALPSRVNSWQKVNSDTCQVPLFLTAYPVWFFSIGCLFT